MLKHILFMWRLSPSERNSFIAGGNGALRLHRGISNVRKGFTKLGQAFVKLNAPTVKPTREPVIYYDPSKWTGRPN